ncbi:murein biosynthesis integral membrane protein MurJ [Thermolongibacillus altinsuensis]
MNANKVIKSSLMVMLILLISRLLGFGREMFLSFYFGASAKTDIYLLAIMIPTILFDIIGPAAATTFIPLFFEAKQQSKDKAYMFSNSVISLVFALGLAVTVVGVFFTPYIVKAVAPEYKGEQFILAVKMMRLAFPLTIFSGVVSILAALLQSLNRHSQASLIGIPFNIILILGTAICAHYLDIEGLVITYVLAVMSQVFFLMLFLYKEDFRIKICIDLRDEMIKKLAKISIPVILLMSVTQISMLVERSIASSLEEGSISALYYAYRLNFIFIGVFSLSLIYVMYPVLANLVAKNQLNDFYEQFSKVLSVMALFIIPVTVTVVIWREEIITLAFQRGAFDSKDTMMTAECLFFYIIGLLGLSWKEVINRAFFSLGNTKTPMYFGVVSAVFQIVLYLVLSKVMGFAGLALASTLATYLVVTLLILRLIRYSDGKLHLLQLAKDMGKYFIAALLMGYVLMAIYNFASNSILFESRLALFITILLTSLLSFVLYLICLYFFKVSSISYMYKIVKQKIKVHKVAS